MRHNLRVLVPLGLLLIAMSHGGSRTRAQSPSTFKIAYYNVQSGFGEPSLPGRSCSFVAGANCRDTTKPMNAWGRGIMQAELRAKLSDPSIIALGLGEAWSCATPANVRSALGWAAVSTARNGVAIVARYGFDGPEQWLQLDTSKNETPSDTMWVLKVPVCLNASCSSSILTFTAHWYGRTVVDADSYGVYEKQAQQTIDFLDSFAGQPRVLIGDLNVFEGKTLMCAQFPLNKPVQMMRDAEYLDAWNAVHGLADGNTGMWNRAGCGSPEGALWKRLDFGWSKQLNPVSMTRFGMVTPGECAPSDHAGILIEYQRPVAPGTTSPPSVNVQSPNPNQTVSGNVTIQAAASDDEGITRVELLVDGVARHIDTSAPYSFSWDSRVVVNGTHRIEAAATDTDGNRSVSGERTITVDNRGRPGDEIVLYARDATLIQGGWTSVGSSTAAGGRALYNTEAGQARQTTARPTPTDYVELSFTANEGIGYRLWIRGSAHGDSIDNDSVHVQFSGSVSSTGSAVYRIGTSSSTIVSLEDCNGCELSGWGWQDNASGGHEILGPLVYFASTGPQRIRIQRREDGFQFDQVVLSAVAYVHVPPGQQKNDSTILPPNNGGTAPPPPPPPGGGDIVIYPASSATMSGAWSAVADATAAGGSRLQNTNAGAAKVATPAASPANYFELTFNAEAGKPYRLWMRGKAHLNHYNNDSVYVQFDKSVDKAGAAKWRIGTTSATRYILEECFDCGGISGWGWEDNGYGRGVLGQEVFFASTGTQRMRVQVREDGLGIDQVLLSPSRYLTTAPGPARNDTTILPSSGGSSPPPPPPPPAGDEVVIYAAASATIGGSWSAIDDASAAGGKRLQNPNAGAAKLTTPLAAPTKYFDVAFNATAGKPYRLWMRARAQDNKYQNDSVFVQFDGSVTSSGQPQWRIGTTDATTYVLEECSGCVMSAWGWQDNGYGAGVLGPVVYFASTGAQRLRVQVREDGLGIDQIVLSAARYLSTPPGAPRNDTTILPK